MSMQQLKNVDLASKTVKYSFHINWFKLKDIDFISKAVKLLISH